MNHALRHWIDRLLGTALAGALLMFTITAWPGAARAADRVEGDGEAATEQRSLEAFDAIQTSGFKLSVRQGAYVTNGTQLMALVPDTMWVIANFKERQLRRVKVGMPATVTSDLYGSGVVYHGKVVGFSGGTGSSLSLIPAQNATGNWIKVVQRLPLRIQLDPKELAEHPLRVGLSMEVELDLAGE